MPAFTPMPLTEIDLGTFGRWEVVHVSYNTSATTRVSMELERSTRLRLGNPASGMALDIAEVIDGTQICGRFTAYDVRRKGTLDQLTLLCLSVDVFEFNADATAFNLRKRIRSIRDGSR